MSRKLVTVIPGLKQEKQRMNEELAKNTGNELARIEADTERDNFMTAQQALEYGLIDGIIPPRR